MRDQLIELMKQISLEEAFTLVYGDVANYVDKIITHAEIVTWNEHGRIGAFVAIYCNDLSNKIAFITMVAVADCHRGRGLATALIAAALAVARSRSLRTCRLQVRQSNLPAMKLYRRLGFYPTDDDNGLITMEVTL